MLHAQIRYNNGFRNHQLQLQIYMPYAKFADKDCPMSLIGTHVRGGRAALHAGMDGFSWDSPGLQVTWIS